MYCLFDVDHWAILASVHVPCLIEYDVVWIQLAVGVIFVILTIGTLWYYCSQTLPRLIHHPLPTFHLMCFIH